MKSNVIGKTEGNVMREPEVVEVVEIPGTDSEADIFSDGTVMLRCGLTDDPAYATFLTIADLSVLMLKCIQIRDNN